jgi:hypothetical protein
VKTLRHSTSVRLLLANLGLALVTIADSARGQPLAQPYPRMAPLAQYLTASPVEEIALARSAAPSSISEDANILTFDGKRYVQAVKGNNGFTCLVERSWTDEFKNPEFWNPRIRVPICLNAAAARSILPSYLKRTQWVIEGAPLAPIELLAKDHPPADPELGSMAMMMSKSGYLADGVGAAGPHLMFYLPRVAATSWGAGLPDSPVFSTPGDKPSITIFYVGVGKWSDGSAVRR